MDTRISNAVENSHESEHTPLTLPNSKPAPSSFEDSANVTSSEKREKSKFEEMKEKFAKNWSGKERTTFAFEKAPNTEVASMDNKNRVNELKEKLNINGSGIFKEEKSDHPVRRSVVFEELRKNMEKSLTSVNENSKNGGDELEEKLNKSDSAGKEEVDQPSGTGSIQNSMATVEKKSKNRLDELKAKLAKNGSPIMRGATVGKTPAAGKHSPEESTTSVKKTGNGVDGSKKKLTVSFAREIEALESRFGSSIIPKEVGQPSVKPVAFEKHGEIKEDSVDHVEEESTDGVNALKKKLAKAKKEIEKLRNLVQTIEEDSGERIVQMQNQHQLEMKKLLEKKEDAEKQHAIQIEKTNQFLQSIKLELDTKLEERKGKIAELKICHSERIRNTMREHGELLVKIQALRTVTEQENLQFLADYGIESKLYLEKEIKILREMNIVEEFMESISAKIEETTKVVGGKNCQVSDSNGNKNTQPGTF